MSQAPTAFADFVERYGPKAGEEGAVLFVREVFGVEPDPWQADVLRAVARQEPRISVRSCHGVGKTALAAWIIWWMLLTHFPQNTIATAPTSSQLEDALLKEVMKWHGKLSEPLQQLYTPKSNRIELTAAPSSSFFSARTSRAEKPEALQGVHEDAGYVLLIADEASGVPEQVFAAAAGSMSGHNVQTLLIGNPVRTQGFFFDTHHKLADMWYTVHVSHTDSPRVSDEFVRDIIRRYGENSAEHRIRCLGEFPRMDTDVMIPFELVQSARTRDIVVPEHLKCVWGLDVARYGGDKNVLLKRNMLAVLPDIQVWGETDTMHTVGRVKAEWDKTAPSQRPPVILVDSIGMGAPVLDRLRELGLPAIGVNVSETEGVREEYLNLRVELWGRAKEWMMKRDVKLPGPTKDFAGKPMDPREDPAEMLANELVIPRYQYTSSGRLKLESKEDIKKRGYPSPNVADAFALTFAQDIATMIHGSAGGQSWATPIERGISVV